MGKADLCAPSQYIPQPSTARMEQNIVPSTARFDGKDAGDGFDDSSGGMKSATHYSLSNDRQTDVSHNEHRLSRPAKLQDPISPGFVGRGEGSIPEYSPESSE
jgi:hypothetical protein